MKNSTFSFIKIITSTALILMLNIAHANSLIAQAPCHAQCSATHIAEISRKIQEQCNQSQSNHNISACRANMVIYQATLKDCKKEC